ncbi:curli major subunit CsgA [Rahnella victoriana]|jgi:major curlin subunit|uniref:curli major subunit CsgA n=1 Tax=Rahnella victoriana TaxID=1510570 RepID=UPI000E6BCF70|nr:curli major subunit CsgA [Rahnella victoriana]TBX32709.1 curlin [Rahnella victoriana]
MKLWKIVAVSALVVSGSAFAGHGGGGDYTPTPPVSTVPTFTATQWNSEIQIYQQGTSNLANATQSGAQKSLTSIGQDGYRNTASTNQTGDGSLVSVSQKGDFNNANVAQTANGSKVLVSQNGSGNYAQASQGANGALTNIVQSGTGNLAYASQN